VNDRTNAIQIKRGEIVSYMGRPYEIVHVVDIERVNARECDGSDIVTLPISSLAQVTLLEDAEAVDFSAASPEDQAEARRRFACIEPTLDGPSAGPLVSADSKLSVARERARAFDVALATVYRWKGLWESTERLSALLPKTRGGGRGESRIEDLIEDQLRVAVEEHLLKQKRGEKIKLERTHAALTKSCSEAGLRVPHFSTLRRRLASEKARRRMERANRLPHEIQHSGMYGDDPGIGFAGADAPLAMVQIDHTPCDVVVVSDDEYRIPIGRPWITLAIDVYSRVVLGFYVSLDRPSVVSVGLCLLHAMLPKEAWLAKRGIDVSAPIYGKIRLVLADNAGEFRAKEIKGACEEYRIEIRWRKVKQPKYGPHIERLLETTLEEIHTLPGTTFSNPKQRGDYDSEGKAVMTLAEFERWLAQFLFGVYHNHDHSALGTTPLKRWAEGINGANGRPGIGMPLRLLGDYDERLMDFLPYKDHVVSSGGVKYDNVKYQAAILREFVDARNPKNPKLKLKLRFRRDPRDISKLYFLHPGVRKWFSVPYRHLGRPQISIWEFRAAQKWAKAHGDDPADEDAVFRAYAAMEQEVENAKRLTKAAARTQARNQSRKRHHERSPKPQAADGDDPLILLSATPSTPSTRPASDRNSVDDSSFDDVELLDASLFRRSGRRD